MAVQHSSGLPNMVMWQWFSCCSKDMLISAFVIRYVYMYVALGMVNIIKYLCSRAVHCVHLLHRLSSGTCGLPLVVMACHVQSVIVVELVVVYRVCTWYINTRGMKFLVTPLYMPLSSSFTSSLVSPSFYIIPSF